MTEITKCEVCNNNKLSSVLDLGLNPMCDDLISIHSQDECINYPIEILFCEECFTAKKKYQVEKTKLFPLNYHYRAKFTDDVLNGMEKLVNECLGTEESFNNSVILDIGCNDGSLLNFFRYKNGFTIGVEPTNAADEALKLGHTVFKNYLSIEVANKIKEQFGSPSIICFTNVFAHIENLPEVLNCLKILMSDNTKLIIENHYLGSIISNNQFDTFYHEHPRTYSARSFSYIAEKLSCAINNITFPSRYGGNIRVELSKNKKSTNDTKIAEIFSQELQFKSDIIALGEKVKNWQNKKKKLINEVFEQFGLIHAKAFPGRAAILLKLLDLDSDIVEAVYEKPGSLKLDHFIPGTRIPIKSDKELLNIDKNIPIFNLAWHIPEEISKYLIDLGVNNQIINILSPEDFN